MFASRGRVAKRDTRRGNRRIKRHGRIYQTSSRPPSRFETKIDALRGIFFTAQINYKINGAECFRFGSFGILGENAKH